MYVCTWSRQGTMKNIPGPTVPFLLTLPSLKSTALSYSWTILMQKINENGKVMMIKNIEMTNIMQPKQPWAQAPSSWASFSCLEYKGDHLLVTSSHICGYGHIYEYGHQMALKSRSKTSFYSNFRRPIRSRGQMDARTLTRVPELGF